MFSETGVFWRKKLTPLIWSVFRPKQCENGIFLIRTYLILALRGNPGVYYSPIVYWTPLNVPFQMLVFCIMTVSVVFIKVLYCIISLQVPARRPAFPEIHQRLRQWEGLGGRWCVLYSSVTLRYFTVLYCNSCVQYLTCTCTVTAVYSTSLVPVQPGRPGQWGPAKLQQSSAKCTV